MEKLTLTALGWDNFFSSQLRNNHVPDSIVGRVASENKTNYGVQTEEGEFIAEVTGKIMYTAATEADFPKVGDWVMLTKMDEDRAIIHEVFQRKTVLSRKAVGKAMIEQIIVTNLDVLFIVQGMDDNFNIARLERYLAAINKVRPVIVLNKADLCSDLDMKLGEVRNRLPGIDIIATSAANGRVDELRHRIKSGETFAFVGSSGVGKSSLINALMDSWELKTSAVREKDSKGQHTTTRREMIFLPQGGILIDTPGMREFQPWANEGMDSVAFTDIEALAEDCRFGDCQHVHEVGCAVKDAIGRGAISEAHYQNYLKLKREMEYQLSLTDINKAQERKKFFMQRIKAYNQIVKNKRHE